MTVQDVLNKINVHNGIVISKSKSKYISTTISSEGKQITKEMTSKGRIIYRDSNGRFAKK